ncbi:MAG: hypothetical protein EOM88_03850 [Clostridia bacterium]|nr:hypothetical protein [Clostridia bacterium]
MERNKISDELYLEESLIELRKYYESRLRAHKEFLDKNPNELLFSDLAKAQRKIKQYENFYVTQYLQTMNTIDYKRNHGYPPHLLDRLEEHQKKNFKRDIILSINKVMTDLDEAWFK